jgi:ketosteroid isomerase-like protein
MFSYMQLLMLAGYFPCRKAGSCMQDLTERDVAEAAERLVAAFAATDTEAYFACFAEDASFIFHTEPGRLEGREDYRLLWKSWLAEGWRVLGCASSNRRIQLAGSAAVFSHDVATTIDTGAGREVLSERETIVFARAAGGEILAVHEHLSPLPGLSDKALS